MKNEEAAPSLLVADEKGQIYDHPTLKLVAKSGPLLIQPQPEHLIPLPFGSQLFTMPGRIPLGWDEKKNKAVPCETLVLDRKKKKCFPVAAFLAPGYLRTLLPAAVPKGSTSPILPLWAYAAVGWKDGEFWVSALQIDPNPHWHPQYFQDDRQVAEAVRLKLAQKPKNRLLHQLSRCALEYHCFAAKNLFLQRWECPLPTSPICNSRCLGCLSLQPGECCPSSQERISFVPSVEEIVEIASPHLSVEDAIVSFGQGCEGEPILQADTLGRAICQIRKETDQGVINLNTNGSLPEKAEALFKFGLDSIRVSLNSFHPGLYDQYYRPQGYQFSDVVKTITLAKSAGVYTAVNLLIFPGVTDRQADYELLGRAIEETGLDLIQMRNLNIDPDLYLEKMKGVEHSLNTFLPLWEIVDRLRQTYPQVRLGYFNQPAKVIRDPDSSNSHFSQFPDHI